MDLRSVGNHVAAILRDVRMSRHDTSPAARSIAGQAAVDRLIALLRMLDRAIDDLEASSAAAAAARTACREHLYPRPAPPCIHEDDGQEEAGMGEPDSVPAPWKSPD